MKYIIGILIVVAGVFFVAKTEWLMENFGRIAWAEEHLDVEGGSRIAYKGLGLIFIFIGFLLITGMWEGFLMGTLGKIFIR
ncbi:MAG: hypothetical protein Q7J14_00445 [Candidatus Magasanikbacteria bacterium]|nr:hypothetical protein [Candidatus Magasanikbacteria bacterium]